VVFQRNTSITPKTLSALPQKLEQLGWAASPSSHPADQLHILFEELEGLLLISQGFMLTPGTDPDIPDKVGCRSVAPSEGTGILHPASPSAMSDPMSRCPELIGKAA